MTLLVISFLAGVLTVAAPCTFTLLPVIVGGSIVRSGNDKKSWRRPLIISLSLGLSVIVFTLILKASTSLLGVPVMVWQFIAGGIIITLGLTFIFPYIWEKFSQKIGLVSSSNKLLGNTFGKSGLGGDVATGFALGPVFSSCNPTYAFIIAAILPISFVEGMAYLIAYAIGLSGVLLVISYLGQNAVQNLGWLNDTKGKFRKAIGILFIIVGLGVTSGYDKKFETFIIERGLYDSISGLEESLR